MPGMKQQVFNLIFVEFVFILIEQGKWKAAIRRYGRNGQQTANH